MLFVGAITLHAAESPNIIIIFTDNQGYADLDAINAGEETMEARRSIPELRDAVEANIFARGGSAKVKSLEAYKLKATMNY